MNEEFEEGTYTIQFERVGKSSQAQEKRGWVEVGALTVRKEKKESVDRSKLQREIQICEKLNSEDYTKESWEKLQAVLESATVLLKKADEETCTSEMNDKAVEVKTARKSSKCYGRYRCIERTASNSKRNFRGWIHKREF